MQPDYHNFKIKWLITIILMIATTIVITIATTPLISTIIGVIIVAVFYLLFNGTLSSLTKISQNVVEINLGHIASLADEIKRVERDLSNGDLNARINTTFLEGEGAFQSSIAGINQIMDSMLNYMYHVPCSLVAFDAQSRFTFFNKVAQAQGFDPKELAGKTLQEVLPPDEAKEIANRLQHVMKTGEVTHYQLSMVSPTGEELTEEHIICSVRDAEGKAFAALEVTFDSTSITKAKTRLKKISDYQDFQASDITNNLREGLNKGLLQFKYKPHPHDDDTFEAAAAYHQVGQTLEHSVTVIKGYVNEITQLLQEFSHGNFDVNISLNYKGDFETIKHSMEGLICSIGSLIAEIQKASCEVEIGASNISESNQELMASFEEQTTAMSDVREAINILTEKTRKSAEDSHSANSLSEQVRESATTGTQFVVDMSKAMDEIKLSSTEIAQIVNVIKGIAFQTDLLALNASVEAARAGEYGKGFGVVAEEVRSLAERSTAAAKDTSEMLAKSLICVDIGVEKTEKMAHALQTINEITARVTEAVANIAHVSNEQAEEIGRIQNSLNTIYQGASSNSTVVQNNASVSEELSSQASMLKALVEQFKIHMSK